MTQELEPLSVEKQEETSAEQKPSRTLTMVLGLLSAIVGGGFILTGLAVKGLTA